MVLVDHEGMRMLFLRMLVRVAVRLDTFISHVFMLMMRTVGMQMHMFLSLVDMLHFMGCQFRPGHGGKQREQKYGATH